jgi:hypothetical protein
MRRRQHRRTGQAFGSATLQRSRARTVSFAWTICPPVARSNQRLRPQARMSIPPRDDMVVPRGPAASTIIRTAAPGRWVAVM